VIILSICGPSILFTYLALYLARMASWRYGLVDRPDGQRKLQKKPVAVCGGIGILVGVLMGLLVGVLIHPYFASQMTIWTGRDCTTDLMASFSDHDTRARYIFLGIAMISIAAVGLIDDLKPLRARHKFSCQIAITGLLILGGYHIENLSVFGEVITLGKFGYLFTAFWFLAAINAINLLDGMDGLLGTFGLITLGTLAGMSFGLLNVGDGIVAAAVAAALLSFLRFNLPPASIYLGDCGSMLIGLVVAALSISSSLKGPTMTILIPAAILTLPILDTSAAIIRRKLTGRSMAAPDRGHYHHILQMNHSRMVVLAITAAVAAFVSGGAILATVYGSDLYSLAAAVAVVLALMVTGLFGNKEASLVYAQLRHQFSKHLRQSPDPLTFQLQGQHDWKTHWLEMVDMARGMNIVSLRMDINSPAQHESFHGRWDRSDSFTRRSKPSKSDLFTIKTPHGVVVAKLLVISDPEVLDATHQVSTLEKSFQKLHKQLVPAPVTQPQDSGFSTFQAPVSMTA
jgi:UDP-GlcNAc:undecaprenyl-phosphate/decaprenyl-phosphate GlcNAc-1-phosphate transferase